jgi:hypothetical protein
VFKPEAKSGDYNHEMDFDNYERWLKTKLIRNLPPSLILIMDSAAYHNVQLNPASSSSSRKRAVIDRFSNPGIPFSI